MTSNLLYPPNSHLLTDVVISAVVAKNRRPASVFNKADNASTLEQPSHPSSHQPTSSSIVQITQPSVVNDVVKVAWNELSTAEKSLQLYRQRRRVTQQRYRKKIDHRAASLEADVAKLQKEVQRIESMLHPPPTVATDTSRWTAAAQFFSLFQNGIDRAKEKEHVQIRFLQAAMAPNIAFNDGYGIHAVLKNWSHRSLHHEKTEIQLVRLEPGSEGIVVAHLSNATTITESMLRKSFLCAGKDGENSEWPSFAWKLLGQRLTIRTIVRFEWDYENSRFDSVFYEADMLTPLLDLLGNMQDASTVLSSSLGIY
ncbi:hypothetical protein AM587_10008418 [Phytophthora nicotianae]|uniref:BZIP transcription factor 1 n=1 Tax=Phytophthora nicotianae TaxID=4792 RepID=A0A0W8DMC6_PHYNI|nr:hypothetical protein AM587_10008418 [Phytophthora nicotianae]